MTNSFQDAELESCSTALFSNERAVRLRTGSDLVASLGRSAAAFRPLENWILHYPWEAAELFPVLRQLVSHDDPTCRLSALLLLRNFRDKEVPDLKPFFYDLLVSTDAAVRWLAATELVVRNYDEYEWGAAWKALNCEEAMRQLFDTCERFWQLPVLERDISLIGRNFLRHLEPVFDLLCAKGATSVIRSQATILRVTLLDDIQDHRHYRRLCDLEHFYGDTIQILEGPWQAAAAVCLALKGEYCTEHEYLYLRALRSNWSGIRCLALDLVENFLPKSNTGTIDPLLGATAECLAERSQRLRVEAAKALDEVTRRTEAFPAILPVQPPPYIGWPGSSIQYWALEHNENVLDAALPGCHDEWSRTLGLIVAHRFCSTSARSIMRSVGRIHWRTVDPELRQFIEASLQAFFPQRSLDRIRFDVALWGDWHVAATGNRLADTVIVNDCYPSFRTRQIRRVLREIGRFGDEELIAEVAAELDFRLLDRCSRDTLKSFDRNRSNDPNHWLGQVLRNLARTALKKIFGGYHHAPEFFNAVVDWRAPNPDDELLIIEFQDRLARFFKPELVTLITLKVVHGCKYPEIAQRLGLPSPDAARMQYNRARRIVEQCLRDVLEHRSASSESP